MAAESDRRTKQDREGLTPEEKLLRAILGKAALRRSKRPPKGIAHDQSLFDALDAISESIESNVGKWNSALDSIEEDLSHFQALNRLAEAAQ